MCSIRQTSAAVFLPDVLLRGDLVKLLERLSAHGRNAITRAAVMLRQVHDAVGRPLGDVIRAGIEALDLDIDTVLAGVLHNPQHRANPALAHMPMDAIVDLVDTYTQEIAAEQTPSLHGFITWVDHLASVEDEAASLPDAPVDVELMTSRTRVLTLFQSRTCSSTQRSSAFSTMLWAPSIRLSFSRT